MQHSVFGYHGSKNVTSPRKTTANIKGVELEIGDENCCYDNIHDKLDELIEENLIKAPYNIGEDNDLRYTIAIENDGSVFKELILKASCNSTLLQGIKMLEEELSEIVENDHGTSCHIHLNNEYLKTLGLDSDDITKTAEFMAPLLYAISGRNINSLRWCNSILNSYDIEDFNLYKRAKAIDNIDCIDNSRYRIVNKGDSNSKTTELRIFSNYYNFNYNYIKLYLEISDLIIEISNKMKNKKYEEQYENIITEIKQFFNKRSRKQIYETHNLKRFLIPKSEIKIQTIREQLNYFNSKIEEFNERDFPSNLERYKSFIRLCRNYSNKYEVPENIIFDLNNMEQSILDITNLIIEDIEEQLE